VSCLGHIEIIQSLNIINNSGMLMGYFTSAIFSSILLGCLFPILPLYGQNNETVQTSSQNIGDIEPYEKSLATNPNNVTALLEKGVDYLTTGKRMMTTSILSMTRCWPSIPIIH